MTYTEAEAVVREYLNDYVPEDAFMARTEALAALDEMRREYEAKNAERELAADIATEYRARLADAERRLAETIPVLEYVSLGRGYVDVKTYPDGRARRVLAAVLASRDQEDQG
jgi:hypothetical protein